MSMFTDEQVETLASAIRSVAYGTSSGPTGLEMLSIAIAGEGLRGSLCESLDGIASAIRDLAEELNQDDRS